VVRLARNMATISPRRGSGRISQDLAASRRSITGDSENHRPSRTEADLRSNIADTTLDPAHPRELKPAQGALTKQVYQQLLGLNPFKSSFLSLYRNLEARGECSTAIVGALLAAAAGVPLPIMFVIFGQIVNSFPPPEDELRVRIGQLLGVAAAYFVITTIYMSCFGRVGEKIAINLREKLLRCLLSLDQGYYDTHDLDVTSLLTAKIETIQVGTSEKVGIFIQSLSYFIAAFIVGFILNAKLTGILLAAVIPAMVIIVATGSAWISRLSKRMTTCTEQANGVLESALRSVKVVQAFGFEDSIGRQHLVHLQESAVSGTRKAIVAASVLGLMYFVAYAANGLAFYVGSGMAQNGGAGTIYAVCLLILDASFVVGQFAPFLEMFARAASAGEEIKDLIDQANETIRQRGVQGELYEFDIHGEGIRFTDVEFAYPARQTVKILRGLTLEFTPGTFNAIVGTSGGGKSTVVSLLTKIYGDYRGHITIGEHELRKLDIDQLRSQISVVEQDSILFSGTIYDNICHGLGSQNLTEAERLQRCNEAVKAAAIDFIDDLPQGLNTTIGNNLQLSGGQKQRLCLARALIKKPAILILDEPTSALDARSETLVAQTVKQIAGSGTTVIMIAHRLSTVLDAEQIVVISDGKVVETGAPTSLAVPGTIFNGLLEAQGTSTDWTARDSPDAADEKKEVKREAAATSILSDGSVETEQYVEDSLSGFELVHKILRLLKPDAAWILLGFTFSVVGGAIIIGEAIAFGNLIQLLNDNSRGEADLRSDIEFYCLIFFILSFIALVCYTGSGSSFGIASTRLTGRVQSALLRNTLRQDMAWFSAPGRSLHELVARINSDSSNLAALSGVVTGTLFGIATSMIGGLTLALVVAWRIAVVLMTCVPVLVTAGYLRLRILTKSEQHHRSAYNEAASIAAESCRNMRTISILGLESNVQQRYQKALEGPYKSGLRFTFASNALLAFSYAITYFVYALAYWWGSKNVREGYYDSVSFFIVLPALLFSAQGAGQAFSLTPEITRARSAAKNICTMLDMQPTILKLDNYKKDDGRGSLASDDEVVAGKKPANSVPKIYLERVTLQYKTDGSKPALRNVTFSINDGENVALVGPSGAGKSSTIALLERFYDAAEGSVAIDGINVCDMDARVLRSRISLVPQEPELFPGSIAYNVKLGAARHQNVTQEDVEDVCSQCGLHDFIMSLPEGYTTDCASNGVTKLSGGQRQRLAIARAMIRNPEILLLDEPTSALDAHSERMVQESLTTASAGRTTVTVAHRLASIQHMDKIIVFDQGTIVEMGTHRELMEKGGLYASMAKAQSVA
jgi:ATP-binding cassette subfamily B (MDR/TAP) protein 1